MPDLTMIRILVALLALALMVIPSFAIVLLWDAIAYRRHHDLLIPATPRTAGR